VGSKTLGMASFYLRAVCQNPNLWSVEDLEEITIRHSKYAAARFAHEAAPALESFANSSPAPFVAGIKAAREESRPPESLFGFVQGITAVARGKEHQDARLELEQRARRLLDRAA
jgi:hypothetical protein